MVMWLPKEGPDRWAYEISVWYQNGRKGDIDAKKALRWINSKRASKIFTSTEVHGMPNGEIERITIGLNEYLNKED